MSESPISITMLNDFIFCPASIYFHALDQGADRIESQDTAQLNGTSAHEKSDSGSYSTRKSVMQASAVYCEKYNLMGRIDTFDVSNGRLTERKKKITVIYDGYVFQLYAQYFALCEMGYDVRELRLYSMDDNKVYTVSLPSENKGMMIKFEKVLSDMNSFDMNDFVQSNSQKCMHCIYEPLCSYSCL